MKRFPLLCLAPLIVLSTFTAASQTIGIKAGLNYSTPKASPPLSGQSSVIGYNIGGAKDFFIYDFFYIQPEVLLSQKGYVYTSAHGFTTKRTFGHLEIPVLFKFVYKAGRQGNTEYYATMGPSVSYVLYGRESTDYSYHEIVFLDNFKRFELSGVGGIGMAYSTGPGFLTVEARYFYGLTTMDNLNKYTNTVVGLSVGYSYFQGRRGIRHRNY